MRAVLLAAGLGSRLRPLTDSTPKCLIPIGGRTLLDIWLDALALAGVSEVVVNLHHLSGQVAAHIDARDQWPRVRPVLEPVLLGSAGTLRANRDFLSSEDMFLAVNADNLTDFDLCKLIDAHREGRAIATLTVFRAARPTECGVIEVCDGVVTGFEEKPANPRSDLANAGMYAFSPSVLDFLEGGGPLDIGYDLLPQLVGRARIVDLGDAYLTDIGTPESLARASREWQNRATA